MTIDGVPITVVSVHGEDSKGWDAAVTWEDVLSLGEQQRLVCGRAPVPSVLPSGRSSPLARLVVIKARRLA